ncbi:endochitinase A-like [Penaeus monodon]|uniref:endochitinase A-like n=1 Tax=Penaeus monodon TaxID=6687 RepID=UPI0018A74142|nr:endochitinase A-like [Penaeus monodon]
MKQLHLQSTPALPQTLQLTPAPLWKSTTSSSTDTTPSSSFSTSSLDSTTSPTDITSTTTTEDSSSSTYSSSSATPRPAPLGAHHFFYFPSSSMDSTTSPFQSTTSPTDSSCGLTPPPPPAPMRKPTTSSIYFTLFQQLPFLPLLYGNQPPRQFWDNPSSSYPHPAPPFGKAHHFFLLSKLPRGFNHSPFPIDHFSTKILFGFPILRLAPTIEETHHVFNLLQFSTDPSNYLSTTPFGFPTTPQNYLPSTTPLTIPPPLLTKAPPTETSSTYTSPLGAHPIFSTFQAPPWIQPSSRHLSTDSSCGFTTSPSSSTSGENPTTFQSFAFPQTLHDLQLPSMESTPFLQGRHNHFLFKSSTSPLGFDHFSNYLT